MTPWTVARQTPLPMDSPDKNIGVGSHPLLQGIFPDPGIESKSLTSPALQADSLPSEPLGKTPFSLCSGVTSQSPALWWRPSTTQMPKLEEGGRRQHTQAVLVTLGIKRVPKIHTAWSFCSNNYELWPVAQIMNSLLPNSDFN